MRLRIDRHAAEQFTCVDESNSAGDRRRAYSAPEPYRAVLVCRNSLELGVLIGPVVDAFISEVQGESPFVREANVGQPHTQVSIFECLPDTPAERTLAQVLASGRRNDDK